MPDDPKAPTAGYAPAVNVLAVINKLRGGTVSGPVDRNLLIRIGIKESLAKRVLNSLATLGLINEAGALTDEFKALVAAKPDEYQTTLAAFLRGAYKNIFDVADPAKATPDELRNAFWGYEPRGQIDSMIRLFVGLCEAAGLVESTPERAARTVQRRHTSTSAKDSIDQKPKDGQPERKGGDNPPPPPPPPVMTTAHEKYLDLLLTKAAEGEADADLLDRIERALGIAPKGGGSP